jgi:hypothetical protein
MVPLAQSFANQQGTVAYPCVAFALDGSFATGEFSATTLRVNVTSPAGTIRTAELSLQATPRYCRLFFPPSLNYVMATVGFLTEGKYSFRVGRLETETGKWAWTSDLEPRRGAGKVFVVEGFLGKSTDLVFSEYGSYEIGLGSKPTVRELLTDKGKVRRPRKFAAPWGFVDPAHNRLWLWRYNHPCPVRSLTLIGEPSYGPTISEKGLGPLGCGPGLSFWAFPDEGTVLGTSTRDDGDWVWRVDLAQDRGEQLKLPQANDTGAIRTVYFLEEALSSPDGEVFAVARMAMVRHANEPPHQMPAEIAVTEVKPLRLLGTVKPKSGCAITDAFAVDHRNGQTTVLAHWCGTWERIHLPDASSNPPAAAQR